MTHGEAIRSVKSWGTFERCDKVACTACPTVAACLGEVDLSPLQKFMGRPRKRFVSFFGVSPRMYGMDYDFDWVPPAPSPEKSPLDKALEDFVAKRKAKRGNSDGHDWPTEIGLLFSQRKCRKCGLNGADIRSADVCDGAKAVKRCDALGDAMRRLSFHEQDIHTRLMPYRREE